MQPLCSAIDESTWNGEPALLIALCLALLYSIYLRAKTKATLKYADEMLEAYKSRWAEDNEGVPYNQYLRRSDIQNKRETFYELLFKRFGLDESSIAKIVSIPSEKVISFLHECDSEVIVFGIYDKGDRVIDGFLKYMSKRAELIARAAINALNYQIKNKLLKDDQ